jgi:hypothetical protein
MKITLFLILFFICICISAQPPRYNINAKKFDSIFQNLDSANLRGYAEGLIQFEYSDGTKLSTSFSKDSAYLQINHDPFEIYDVSTKNYIIWNNEIIIRYSTYNLANAFFITIGGRNFKFSLIDGACMGVIGGLDYEYLLTGDRELLKLHFSDKVGLYAEKGYPSKEAYVPELFILKGSTLIFSVKK